MHVCVVQAERALLDMGDHVADMLKCNQALSATAMTLIDATRKLLDTHADNGQGLHTLTKFEKDPGPSAGIPGSLLPLAVLLDVAAAVEPFFSSAGFGTLEIIPLESLDCRSLMLFCNGVLQTQSSQREPRLHE